MSARLALSALVALVTVRGATLPAQETAPLVLRLPSSPRAFGLGNAYVGGEGADAIFFNPANVGRTTGLLVSAARFRSASTEATIASSTSLGTKLAVAAFAQWLDYGSAGFPTPPGLLTTRGPDDAQSLAAGMGAATIVKKFRIGVAAKYVEERIAGVRGGRPAFDVGLAREIRWLTVGFAVQNLGRALDVGGTTARLPTRLSVGATTRRLPIGAYFDVLASAAVLRERDGSIVPGGGAELVYEPVSGWTAKLRAGLHRPDPSSPAIGPITLGGSLGLDRFSLDYSVEWYRVGGTVHRFGVRIE